VRVARYSALEGWNPSWGSIAEALQALKLHVALVQAPRVAWLHQYQRPRVISGPLLFGRSPREAALSLLTTVGRGRPK
jgi:hypothetical protein